MKESNFARKIIPCLLFVWQILQIWIGLLASRIAGVKHEFSVMGVTFIYSVGFVGFRSYGPIAIIDARQYRTTNVLNRRTSKLVLAYARISKILGPAFLLFLVISSFKVNGRSLGFMERWAESIAGVQ